MSAAEEPTHHQATRMFNTLMRMAHEMPAEEWDRVPDGPVDELTDLLFWYAPEIEDRLKQADEMEQQIRRLWESSGSTESEQAALLRFFIWVQRAFPLEDTD